MTRLDIPGGWYTAACPAGPMACIVPAHKLIRCGAIAETSIGYPPGDEPLFIDITTVGAGNQPFRIAGQGHFSQQSWEWMDGRWNPRPQACGADCTVYDLAGVLHYADCGQVGSQGWRYVEHSSPAGRLVTGSSTTGPAHGLSNYTVLVPDLWIGQGHDAGGVLVWDRGALRTLDSGACYDIKARWLDDDRVAIAYYKVDTDGLSGHVVQATFDELRALPAAVVYPTYHFTHPVIVAPFKADGSGAPDLFLLGTYSEATSIQLPTGRLLLAHDALSDWTPPANLRPYDIPMLEFYRDPSESLFQSNARWSRQLSALKIAWHGDIGVIPMFYTQQRWSIQEVLDGLAALDLLVNTSPRVKLIAPFEYNRANGITAHPELQRTFADLMNAAKAAGLAELPPVTAPPKPPSQPPSPPAPVPPKPTPTPTPPRKATMIHVDISTPAAPFLAVSGTEIDNGNGSLSVRKRNGKIFCVNPNGGIEERDDPGGPWESFVAAGTTLVADRESATYLFPFART